MSIVNLYPKTVMAARPAAPAAAPAGADLDRIERKVLRDAIIVWRMANGVAEEKEDEKVEVLLPHLADLYAKSHRVCRARKFARDPDSIQYEVALEDQRLAFMTYEKAESEWRRQQELERSDSKRGRLLPNWPGGRPYTSWQYTALWRFARGTGLHPAGYGVKLADNDKAWAVVKAVTEAHKLETKEDMTFDDESRLLELDAVVEAAKNAYIDTLPDRADYQRPAPPPLSSLESIVNMFGGADWNTWGLYRLYHGARDVRELETIEIPAHEDQFSDAELVLSAAFRVGGSRFGRAKTIKLHLFPGLFQVLEANVNTLIDLTLTDTLKWPGAERESKFLEFPRLERLRMTSTSAHTELVSLHGVAANLRVFSTNGSVARFAGDLLDGAFSFKDGLRGLEYLEGCIVIDALLWDYTNALLAANRIAAWLDKFPKLRRFDAELVIVGGERGTFDPRDPFDARFKQKIIKRRGANEGFTFEVREHVPVPPTRARASLYNEFLRSERERRSLPRDDDSPPPPGPVVEVSSYVPLSFAAWRPPPGWMPPGAAV